MNNTSSMFSSSHMPAKTDWSLSPEIIALSASDRSEILNKISTLKNHLPGTQNMAGLQQILADARKTYSVNEKSRLLIIVESSDDLLDMCDSAIENLNKTEDTTWNFKNIYYGENRAAGKLAFAFPGQGSQYVFMGKDLVDCFPEAQKTLRHANELYSKKPPLTDFIFPEMAGSANEKTVQEENLRSTDIAQPSIGAISLAMIKVLQRFNVKPHATCGHSYGELTALCAAGKIDESAFFDLSVERGRLMAGAGDGTDKGGMLAVKAPLDQIEKLIEASSSDVILANRNSPDQGVLSGPTDAIMHMKTVCAENKIRAVVLPVAAAFHSRLVKNAAEPFQKKINSISFSESSLTVFSNTTGSLYPDSPEEAKKLLGRHLISPVHFVDEIKNMYDSGIDIFVEAGPKNVLTGLVKSILKDHPVDAIAMDASSGRKSGLTDLAKLLCHLSSIGYLVDLNKWCQP